MDVNLIGGDGWMKIQIGWCEGMGHDEFGYYYMDTHVVGCVN
jgi:hypothetical protein